MQAGKASGDEAKAIYQDLLDRITQAYWDDDFAALEKMIHVPHKVSSFGPILPIETRDDLHMLFESIRSYLRKQQVTDYHRVCLAAQFKTTHEIEGMHETRVIRDAQLLEGPYPVKSILRFIQGKWRVCESDNALEPDHGFGRAFHEHMARSATYTGLNHGQDSQKGNSAND